MNKKLFVVKARKDEADELSIPRHPEFAYIKSLRDTIWEAKNVDTDEVVRVIKIDKGDFFEYEIEEKA